MAVQSGPQRYIAGVDAYQQLPVFIKSEHITRVLFLHGIRSLAAAKPYLPTFGNDVTVVDVLFNGECSYEEIARVKAIAEANAIEMVIALGGGKVIDTGKSVTAGTHLYLVNIPTLASNCAPWSALSVHYYPDGTHRDHVFYNETANLLLFEPRVILHSPLAYFIAGLADTLVKFYEAELSFQQLTPDEFTVGLTLAHQLTIACKQTFFDNAQQAVADMRAGKLTHTWRTAAETVIVTSGLVGGWGEACARPLGAHKVHDALTYFPETKKLLHGERVGYGILVQLAAEGQESEITRLLPLYRALNLPYNFKTLGFSSLVDDVINRIAHETTADWTIPLPVTEAKIREAILRVETLSQTASSIPQF